MSNFKTNIDKLVAKILEEEIQSKSDNLSEAIKESLKGGQKFIAKQAEPKNKITGADFKKLRDKKKETKEQTYFEDEFIHDEDLGDYQGDDSQEMKAEKLSSQEPTYVGKGLEDNKMKANLMNKVFGSFQEQGNWYDEMDAEYEGPFDFDYDEEEFGEFEPFYEKFGDKTSWFPGKNGKRLFDMYKEKFGPMIVRVSKGLEENAETEEGNAFTGALAKAKEQGDDSFEVDGKKFNVKESKEKKCSKCGMKNCKCNHKTETKERRDKFDGRKSKVIGVYSNIDKQREMKEEEKWIQKTEMKKGALHKKLGVPQGEKIPVSKLKSVKKDLMKKSEGDKKLSATDSKLLKQVNLALTLKDIKESKNILRLSEDELVNLIEKIVMEEQTNIKSQEALGLKKTKKALDASKKENEQYHKEVSEKMKKYTKDSTKKDFEMNPEDFPQSNYTIDDMKEKTMKYHPSQAVEEYIEAFAYPGMTNLVFDEIKPDEKKIEKHLKGDSTMGNAVTDKDGKALGNVVPSKVGDRFMKNFEDNLYGAEQMNGSYKRQPQPVDVNGSEKMEGSLKSIRKGSTAKAGKIMSQLESTTEKKEMKINEDILKMKSLIGYNTKTQ